MSPNRQAPNNVIYLFQRLSLDEEPNDLEPVSPDNGEIIKGMLPKQKYLMGALTIDYLQYKVTKALKMGGVFFSFIFF